MQTTITLKPSSEQDNWRGLADKATHEQLESAADALLAEMDDGAKTYTEKALARKIRIEDKRLDELEELATPKVAIDYLMISQVQLLINSAKLTKLQGAMLVMALYGWDPNDISHKFNLPYDRVIRLLRITRGRVARGGSPYDGLYEVYWSEVHRYVYRGK